MTSEASTIAIAIALAWVGAAMAAPAQAQQTIVIPSGTTDTGQRQLSGTDTLTVELQGELAPNADPAISWNDESTGLVIVNGGTIRSTANDGRAIDASGADNIRTITLTNNVGAVIESAEDAFRIGVDPAGGTITVNNAGTILTTAGGQALDFAAAVSGSATIVINNTRTGALVSVAGDAVHPGQGATVNNAGQIRTGGAGSSFDGIDWQGATGRVVNTNLLGTISGGRHGVTGDTDVDIYNTGVVEGRSGSGVHSGGDGTVVNHGVISGGGGVSIAGTGMVRNSGEIDGVSSRGITMGGGTIVNDWGGGRNLLGDRYASIIGRHQGILIDRDANPAGAADAPVTVMNNGVIRGSQGEGIRLVGNFDDTIVTSGWINGGNGVALDMGGGDDTLTVISGVTDTGPGATDRGDPSFAGAVDGGAGADRVVLAGTGDARFAGSVNFESLRVAGGNWTLGSALNYALGTDIAAGATLTGNAATLTGSIANRGTLVVRQDLAATLAAALTGTGTLVKTGPGTLAVGQQPGFTGPTTVEEGRFDVLGALGSPVTVLDGAAIGGTGSVAALVVEAGGTVAPGSSPGTLVVTGAFAQQAGSTYAAEITPAGLSDRIAVGGAATVQNGAVLAVTREPGTYTVGTRYVLLTADGGITGAYTLSQTADAGTELRYGQDVNSIFVDVARTGASLAGLSRTGNQAAVARALAPLGTGNAAYAALTLVPDDDTVRTGLELLSGEIHASLRSALVGDATLARGAVLTRLTVAGETDYGLWGQALAASGNADGTDGAAPLDRQVWGALAGIDVPVGANGRIGLAGGYTGDESDVDGRLSRAELDAVHLLGYAGGNFGALRLRGGAGYAWVNVATHRSVFFPDFSSSPAAAYDARILHGFAEIGVAFHELGAEIEPFAGFAGLRVETDAFAETGGPAALHAPEGQETYGVGQLGVGVRTPIGANVHGHGSVAWQHVFGGTGTSALLAFAGGPAYEIVGTTLSENAAVGRIGLVYAPNERVRLSIEYEGMIGDAGGEHAGRATLSIGI